MEFKRLTMEDVPLVAAVIRDAFAGPPWGEDWNDAQRLTQYVREGMDGENALAFGLADGEGLAAVALGHVRHWHNRVEYILEDFCVCQRCQGQGSGAELMTAVKNACRDLAIDEIGLRTRRDAGAYHFYEKQGFAVQEKDVYFKQKL